MSNETLNKAKVKLVVIIIDILKNVMYNEYMEMEKVLEYLGLTEKEAKIYLAVLQLGKGSVPSISVKAGTKRPTTYIILEELRKKDLVRFFPRKNKMLYAAISPEVLLYDQKEKEVAIRKSMPELMAIYNSQKEKPKVTYYQGEGNILKLYEEIFKEREILFYGSIASIPSSIYKKIEKHLRFIRNEKVEVREILQADEKSIEFAKQESSENHRIKIANTIFVLSTDNIIFGNKVAIITYKDDPMAVVIENNDVVKTYRAMFEMAWNSIGDK